MTHPLRVLWLLPLLAACSGSEIVGLHLAVQADGSATLTARALVEAGTPGPAEVIGKGVTWGKRAALVYSQGAVPKLEDLRFSDDSLRIKPRMDANKITVAIERGPTSGWVAGLVPEKAKRRELALVYDPLAPSLFMLEAFSAKELGVEPEAIRAGIAAVGTALGTAEAA